MLPSPPPLPIPLRSGDLLLQSGDRRRISTCSGYSTGQTSSGSPRRISGASGASVSGYCSEDSGQLRAQHWRYSFRRYSQYSFSQLPF